MTEDTWREQLRSQGHRVTPQREAILRAVGELSHPTAESIHQHLQRAEPALNLSTVYRTLAVLSDLGVVTHAHIDAGPPVYHLAGAPPHIHLSCLTCHRVLSIPAAAAGDFADAVEQATGFRIDPTHSGIYGHCEACR